jgi:hypothetical protein
VGAVIAIGLFALLAFLVTVLSVTLLRDIRDAIARQAADEVARRLSQSSATPGAA